MCSTLFKKSLKALRLLAYYKEGYIFFQLNILSFHSFTWMIFFLITHFVLSTLIFLERTALSFSATSQTKSFSWELFLNLFFHNSQRWAKERFSWLAMPKLKENKKTSWYLERLNSKLGEGVISGSLRYFFHDYLSSWKLRHHSASLWFSRFLRLAANGNESNAKSSWFHTNQTLTGAINQ